MPSNNWGPYTPATTYEYPADGGVPTAPANPPQSPSGTSQTAPNRGQLNTEGFLSGVGENISQQGLPVQTSQPHLAGVPDTAIQWNNTTAGNGTVGTKFS
jgi:hypothetical protein